MVQRGGWPGRALAGVLLATVAVPALAAETGGRIVVAQQTGNTAAFAIAGGPLPGALAAFGQVTGLQVLYPSGLAQGVTSAGVTGTMTPREALNRLLAGTGLTARFVDAGTVTLEKAAVQGAAQGTEVLDPVTVEGAGGGTDRGRSEGTGSYAPAGPSATATKLPLMVRETPQSVSVMTRQRMDDQGLTEIKDVLGQTVGVTLAESGALGTDGKSVYARGFAISNYQVNGVPRSTLYGFGDSIADMAVFDRVEVVRGATGLLNGVGDPSAAVNLVRKRPTAGFSGHAEAQVGSWNRTRVEGDVSGPLTADGRVRGRLVGARQESDSFIDRLHQRKNVLYGVIEADITPDTLLTAGLEYQKHTSSHASRAGFPLFYTDGGKTALPRSHNSAANWAYFMHDNLTAFTEVKHSFAGGWTAAFNVEHMRREYDGVLGYGARGALNRDGTGMGIWPGRWNSQLQQTSLGLDVNGPFELFGRQHEVMAGVSGSYAQRSGPDYPLWYLSGYDPSITNYFTWAGAIAEPVLTPIGSSQTIERQMAGYLATRLKPVDGLSVILGGRLSRWQEQTASRPYGAAATATARAENGVFTPYAGIVYDLTDVWSVYGSYTSIFKPQDNKDVAGASLDPLTGNAYEAGVKAEFLGGRLTGSAAVFLIEQDNLAETDPGRFTPDGAQAYRAVKGARSRGAEIELSGEVMAGWQVGGGIGHTVIRKASGERMMTELPKDTVKLFTTYRLPGRWDRLTVGANVRWQGAMFSGSGAREYRQDGFAVADLMARYQVTEAVAATLNVNNVFDKRYLTNISSYGYYGEPFNMLLSVRASW